MWPRLQDAYRTTFGQATVAGVLLFAALPPLDLWPLAWIAPIWWVLLIRRSQLAGRRPYRAIYLAGFLFWLAAVHWVRLSHWSAFFGWIALAFYLAFYLPVFVGLARVAVHRLGVPVLLAAPVVWTGLELARGHVLGGFTMASLGHTQYRWIELIQLSDLAGAYGVGFVVMFVAACLGRTVPCEDRLATAWPLLPAAAMLGAALTYGHLRVSHEQPPPQARIALIQGSIDTQVKHDPDARGKVFDHYYLLSQEAVENSHDRKVDLVVWPETMFSGPLVDLDKDARAPDWWDETEDEFREHFQEHSREVRLFMGDLASALGTSLVLGVDRRHYGPQGERRYNSAVFVTEQGAVLPEVYDKNHLVLLGEHVPLARRFPCLQSLTPLQILDAGKTGVVFELDNGLRISPNICYETVIPQVIRRQVNELKAAGTEPDILLNLTNDGWFYGSSELTMHLVCGVFRAVECRKPLLIAANTGISAHIDADGRILARGPRRHVGLQTDTPATLAAEQLRRRNLWRQQYGRWPEGTATILADVAADPRHSWYLAYGDWPAGLCLAASAVFALAGLWRRVVRERGGNCPGG